jgi:hypothetical protein
MWCFAIEFCSYVSLSLSANSEVPCQAGRLKDDILKAEWELEIQEITEHHAQVKSKTSTITTTLTLTTCRTMLRLDFCFQHPGRTYNDITYHSREIRILMLLPV